MALKGRREIIRTAIEFICRVITRKTHNSQTGSKIQEKVNKFNMSSSFKLETFPRLVLTTNLHTETTQLLESQIQF